MYDMIAGDMAHYDPMLTLRKKVRQNDHNYGPVPCPHISNAYCMDLPYGCVNDLDSHLTLLSPLL